MRATLTGAAALLLSAAIASPAFAQSGDQVREARRHMEVGQEYYLQERWEEAATEFLAAHELRAHPAFLHNAAMAFHRLGAAGRAIELYRRYLDEAPEAPDRADVEDWIRLLDRAAASGAPVAAAPPCEGEDCPPPCPEGETCPEHVSGAPEVRIERVELDPETAAAGRTAVLQSVILVEAEPEDAQIILLNEAGIEVARGQAPLEHTAGEGRYSLVLQHPEYREVRTPLQVRAGRFYVFHIEMSQPPAFLQVIANIPGATVYLDDRSVGPVGTTPWGDVVRTGAHTLWIERPGYAPLERQVEVELGQEQEVDLELERLPFGMARVLANIDGATVEVDGEAIGEAPIEGHQLDPGEHRLRVRARGMKDWQTLFTINRGQTTRILVRMNPSPSRTSAWISLGFSGLTFAVAGVLGWYSTVVYRDVADLAESGRLATDDNRMVGGFLFALGADVGFAVGAAMAGLTLYYFLRDPLPPSEGRVEEPVDFTENPELPVPEEAPAPALPPSGPTGSRAGSALSRFGLSPFGVQIRFLKARFRTMSRMPRRLLPWLLLVGCTSQPYCEFEDTAPVYVLPTPEGYPDGDGYGRVMFDVEMGHPDIAGLGRFVAVSAGPGTQVEVFLVEEGGDLAVARSSRLAEICDVTDRGNPLHDCYERLPGSALGYRSSWVEGEDCLAVGMTGHDALEGRSPAIGFWCALGATPHPPGDGSPGPYLIEVDNPVLSMATVLSPEERLFAGTDGGLLVLEGSATTPVPVSWTGDGLPPPASRIEGLSVWETEEVDGGFLLALGLPEQRQVLVAEYRPDDEATPEVEEPSLLPRACVEVDEQGFGAVVRLAPLRPGGDLYLLAAAGRDTVGRVPAVHVFPLDLGVDPADVACAAVEPEESLGCAAVVDDQGRELDRGAECDVEASGFGVAFDVGNIDDTPELEVVVGAPGARVSGYDRAGAAYIFRPLTDGETPVGVLTDSASTEWPFEVDREDDRLGDGVLVVPIGAREEVLLGAPGARRLLMFLCTGVGLAAPGWDRPGSSTGSLVDARCRDPER